jgi:hypothetical protein
VRLTLRTLLAYLDDTLEPSEAKVIGQKVAESDTAQELIGRIKQVTRRRRLTIPPATGPGGKLDPNTVAEYLDNTLGPDPTAEVEQTCLGSDVHLADIAACHQILTLVLGEPVLIPPSSRQRMYGLVKGREAIPFRKPPSDDEAEPEGAADFETDETLRLGLPPYRSRGSWSSQLVVIGVGLAAGLLLFLAILQALRPPHRTPDDNSTSSQVKGPGTSETTQEKETPTAKDTKNTGPTQGEKTSKGGSGKETRETKETKETGEKKIKTTEPEQGNGKDTKPDKHTMPADIPVEAPATKQVEVGQYLPAVDGQGLLLQRQAEKGTWRVLGSKDAEVVTGRSLVSLPGCPATVELQSGLRLTLWGALREDHPLLPIQESRVALHHHPALDADLTLERGRIVLLNPLAKPLRVRLRVDNPTNPDLPETWDLTLEKQGTAVLVDLFHVYYPGEPFYDNPKDKRRIGPEAFVNLIVRKGAIRLHREDRTLQMNAPPGPALLRWNSRVGRPSDRINLKEVPNEALAEPRFPDVPDARMRDKLLTARKEMLKARDTLRIALAPLDDRADVGLANLLKSTNRQEQILVVRCFGALDNLPELVDALADEDRPDVRQAAVDVLRGWITEGRNNDYILLGELSKKYLKTESGSIMHLLHTFAPKDVRRTETFGYLIANLNNPKVVLRELAAWHLYRLAPGLGASVGPFVASAPAEQRDRVRLEWEKLLQAGKLPPPPPPPPPGQ